MVRSILAVALMLALALSASAYDFLYSGDTAMTHDAGSFGVTGSFLYFMADSYYDADGESQDGIPMDEDAEYTGMWIPVSIYYSAMDQLEIGATPVFVMDKIDHGEVEEGEPTECKGTGLSDTWVWAKYAFMPEPMVTARLGFKVATGNDEPDEMDELATGSGQMDLDAAVMFGLPMGDAGQLDASVGYRYRMAGEEDVYLDYGRDEMVTLEFKPGDEIQFYAGYTYFLGDMMDLRLGFDGFFGSDWEAETVDESLEPTGELEAVDETGANAVYINPGFDYVMDSGISLGVDVHYPLMGTNVGGDWGFGLSVGWGM